MQWKDFQSLRECPFCGGENIAVGSDKGTVYRRNTAFGDLTRSVPTVRWAYCVDCGCVAPAEKVNNFDGFYKPDEQEDALNRAISAWNRRAQPENKPVDAVPVVRGEWILVGTNEHDYETSVEEKCSLCGRYVYRYDTEPQDNYCPNCGADMRGREAKE
jgi:predicted RNA-binding Zn-ribbon protein involved in translation (DUF1610 family)